MTPFQSPVQQGQAAALPKIYTQHPLSAAFPPMTAEEFQELKDSIETIGVQNTITVVDGMVIDGWHRYGACIELVMTCPVVELAPDIDPRDFVMAQNQARRHVTKAQMAMAVTAVYQWKPHGYQGGKVMHTECASSQLHTECAVIGESEAGCTLNVQAPKSTTQMAEIAGVHRNTIVQAQTVTAQATTAVVDAVKRGELGLPKAAAIAKLPPDQQAQAISKPLPRPVSVIPPPKTSHPDAWDNAPKGDTSTLPEGMTEADFGPSEEEIAEALASEKADRELVAKMLASDDVLAELAAEVKRLTLIVEQLTRRNNSLLDEKADAQRWMKKYEARNRHLLKEMDALKKGGTE